MEAKTKVDTLAEGHMDADVKTLRDTLVKVQAYGEVGQTTTEHKLAEL